MRIVISNWDSADYLDRPEAVAAYLEAAFEDGDPKIITHALGVVARSKGILRISRETGLSREALYKALSNKGDPRLSTLMGVMKALGLKLTARAA